jgi:hypothetical protein
VFVDLYYKLILINIFIKHNRINNLYCAFKYFDLHLSLNFFSFFSIYRNFFIELFWPQDLGHTIDMYSGQISCPGHIFLVLTYHRPGQYFFFIYFFYCLRFNLIIKLIKIFIYFFYCLRFNLIIKLIKI